MATIAITKGYNDPTGFTSGETVTPAKLNSAQSPTAAITFVTADDTDNSTLEVSGGKFRVKDGGVVTAKIANANVTQGKLAANVAGNGPVVFASSAANQSIPNTTFTKVTLGTEETDSNSNFDSSRLTPTVAGYYQFSASSQVAGSATSLVLAIYKNGVTNLLGADSDAAVFRASVDGLIYMNGSTDYAEMYAWHASGSAKNISSNFTACLLRAA
jgi:hypothetical protein